MRSEPVSAVVQHGPLRTFGAAALSPEMERRSPVRHGAGPGLLARGSPKLSPASGRANVFPVAAHAWPRNDLGEEDRLRCHLADRPFLLPKPQTAFSNLRQKEREASSEVRTHRDTNPLGFKSNALTTRPF